MFKKLVGNSKKILSISNTPTNIPNSINFYRKIDTHLPFENNSFDFVYCSEPLEVFKTPEQARDEINRICDGSGLIRTKSPIYHIIHNTQPGFISWTNSDTLMFVPSERINLSGIFTDLNYWMNLYHKENLYHYDWYTWKSPSKLKICVPGHIYFEDYLDCDLYIKEGLDEFEKNIRFFKKLIQ